MVKVPQGVFRASGWMLIAAGVTNFIVSIVHLEDTPADLAQLPHFLNVAVGTHVAMLLATPLILMGLAGLYLRQAERLRWWGWIGCFLMFFLFIFEMIHAVLQVYQYPVLFDGITTEAQLKAASDTALKTMNHDGFPTTLSLVAMPGVLLGFALITIAMYRSRVFSKWLALTFLLMPSTYFLPWESYGKYVFPVAYLTYAAYGVLLATERKIVAAPVTEQAAAA